MKKFISFIAAVLLAFGGLADDAGKYHSTAMNERAYGAAARQTDGLKVLFIGNSITLHGPLASIGWTNNWGMAASSQEKDYVHIVTHELEKRFGRKADLVIQNFADFERGFQTYDWRQLDKFVAFDPDVLVIALGENVKSLEKEEDKLAWRDAFKKLVGAFLDGKKTKPLAAIRGTFWPDANKDWAMENVASDYAIPFVKADVYPIPGMDAKTSGYKHPGIQAHPGDKGMAEIAARILEALLPAKTDFTAWMDGQAVRVRPMRISAMEYNRIYDTFQRPANQTERGSFVAVEAAGATAWRVKVARQFTNAVVRPLAAKVKVQRTAADELTFTLPRCGHYVLELDNYHEPLEIFVEPKNDFTEFRKTATLTFGPGLHLTRGIQLKSHDRVYIDKDAVVYGGFALNDVEDVEIRGYGVICGTTARRPGAYSDDGKIFSILTPIRAVNSKRVTIEGPIVLDSPEWCIALFDCADVELSHVKVTGAWRYNTDGIDLCNCRNVKLHDSYIHSFDDTIVVKGVLACREKAVENIHVARCVCWCGWGRTLENGLETWASAWRNVVFEDCDLIHNSMVALSVHLGGSCAVEDITFRNIRLEYDASRAEAEYQHKREDTYSKGANRPAIDYWFAALNGKMYGKDSLYKSAAVSPDEPFGTFKTCTLENISIQVDEGVPAPKVGIWPDKGTKFGEIKMENVTVNGKSLK